ncbi:thioether cross-link-forming SCIFF peptide maturase [Actinophytocola sp. KF-1]
MSTSDVPHRIDLVVHDCEDCACAVSSTVVARDRTTALPDGPLVQAPNVVETVLDEHHSVFFSPFGNGGAVVLNTAAAEVFRAFATPVSTADVRIGVAEADLEPVVRRLVEQDLVHPVGRAPRPRYAESSQLTAWLHVTNACNLRCPYCYVHKTDDAMEEETARRSVDALVRSAVDHGFRSLRLKYAGGEASMNPAVVLALHDHAVACCAAAGLGLDAVLLSNGVAIPAAFADGLKARGIRVMVSLDGIGAAHDAQRPNLAGRPTSAMVQRTVERLIEMGLPPHISVTITSRNTEAVADVVRYALERDLTFSFNFFRDNECSTSHADLKYEQDAMIDGMRSAFAAIEERLPPWSVLGTVLDRGQLVEPRQRPCGAGHDYVVIDQRGGIAQCHMDLGASVGHVDTHDPVAAVRDERAPLRNLLVDEKQGCRDCEWRQWCTGGCPLATFRATGRFDVRSPNCGIYQTIYPEALRLEGLRLLKYAVAGQERAES